MGWRPLLPCGAWSAGRRGAVLALQCLCSAQALSGSSPDAQLEEKEAVAAAAVAGGDNSEDLDLLFQADIENLNFQKSTTHLQWSRSWL